MKEKISFVGNDGYS